MAQLVHDFETGSMDQKDLLGGKGANLAEMTRLGIPVPPGFTITTDACRAYLASGTVPPELFAEVDEHLERLEARMGRTLGDGDDPLLVSVRSGAKFSMPGMMETVLNIGLGDTSVEGLAAADRQPPLRLGLLPPTGADVRQDRARPARRPLRGRHRRGQGRQGRHRRRRPRRRRPARPRDALQGGRRGGDRVAVPAGPARAAARRRAGRLQLVELRPRDPLPPPRADPHRPRHRRQRAGDGLRQPRRVLRLRASPSPATRRPAPSASTATTCRTPRARTSSPASATPCTWPTSSGSTRRATTSWSTSWPASRATTATCATSSSPSSRATCGCCRPGWASAPPRPPSASPSTSSTRASSPRRRP